MRLTNIQRISIFFLTLALSAYFWIYIKGPFIDTSFELKLLQQSLSFSNYLELIRNDNQPPGQKIFTYFLYFLTGDSMNLTRLITTMLLGGLLYSSYIWFFRATSVKPTVQTFTLFTLAICVGPATLSAITIQRYSSLASVLWCTAILVAVVVTKTSNKRLTVVCGCLIGAALFFSYTSWVLFLIVLVQFLSSSRKHMITLLYSSMPGILANVGWFIYAGPVHRALVFAKSEMPVSRKLGALWENSFWLFFGPASLPSVYLFLLTVLLVISIIVVRHKLRVVPKSETFFISLQFILPIVFFSFAGLANANMAGPGAAVIIHFLARLNASSKAKGMSQLAFGYLFLLPVISTLFLFSNFNVLRPYYWANTSNLVVHDLEHLTGKERLRVLSLSDINIETQIFGSEAISLQPIGNQQEAHLKLGIGDYFVFSNEIDKSLDLAKFMNQLNLNNLTLNLVGEYGQFTQSSIRHFLHMYNTSGSQYYLYVITPATAI